MRPLICIGTGACGALSYTYRPPGAAPSVSLVCEPRAARPPKGAGGAGDRGWLRETPFLTADVSSRPGREPNRVLLGIDGSAAAGVEEHVLGRLPDHVLVPVGGDDASLVADGMSVPLLVVTRADADGGVVAFLRKRLGEGP